MGCMIYVHFSLSVLRSEICCDVLYIYMHVLSPCALSISFICILAVMSLINSLHLSRLTLTMDVGNQLLYFFGNSTFLKLWMFCVLKGVLKNVNHKLKLSLNFLEL